jgi:cytosine/adenosine deaminase-related metal-dependent hydrolase
LDEPLSVTDANALGISEMNSAWHVHRAVKGAAAVIAPGKFADLAVFELLHPCYFGLHDRLLGPVAAAGRAHLCHLVVGGRVVVEHGTIPGLDLERLRHDGARVVARLAA